MPHAPSAADRSDPAIAATWLFVPGTRPDRFAKASGAGADVMIIDLEDAVPAAGKDEAREQAARWVAEQRAVVRINTLASDEGRRDVAALRGLAGLAAVVVPKAEDPEALDALGHDLGGVPLVALVESAAGVLVAPGIAATPAISRLAFGNLDFAADCGLTVSAPEEPELAYARSALVVASRAAGLAGPVDGVTVDPRDLEGLAAATRRAAAQGFAGKLCIHPAQVPVAASHLAPTLEQVAWAARVVDAASRNEGAFLLDGEMVDPPVVLRARAVLGRQNLC